MHYLSDVNVRAVLSVLCHRAGGTLEISNAELYDAMLPHGGRRERFRVDETTDGIRRSVTAEDLDG